MDGGSGLWASCVTEIGVFKTSGTARHKPPPLGPFPAQLPTPPPPSTTTIVLRNERSTPIQSDRHV